MEENELNKFRTNVSKIPHSLWVTLYQVTLCCKVTCPIQTVPFKLILDNRRQIYHYFNNWKKWVPDIKCVRCIPRANDVTWLKNLSAKVSKHNRGQTFRRKMFTFLNSEGKGMIFRNIIQLAYKVLNNKQASWRISYSIFS